MFGKFKSALSLSKGTGAAFTPRYDRCAHIFMSAICMAATVILWLDQ